MAGIYIHIPFCKQACNYCDFHFSTSLKNKDAFLDALKKEIAIQKDYFGGEEVSTIYFGGGTPSMLDPQELMGIFETLHTHFNIAGDAEITLEANPDDLTEKRIIQLKHTPVNRFSIGIQSFYGEDLKLMNRAHNSTEALDAVRYAQDHGFENITIDLIYGIPTLTEHKWRNNLQIALSLDIRHISAYCLTVEPKTSLAHAVKAGTIKNVDEEQSARHFEIMLEGMKKNGFVQYEISNFCKDGFYSRHNSNYWLKEKYLGLGPSAHSYNGTTRQWNVSNNALYIRSLEKGELHFEQEELTPAQRYNEYVLTSLRTMWGTSLDHISRSFGDELLQNCLAEAEKYIRSGDLLTKENKLFLTDKGKLIADRIASDLFK
ncbi:MAG: putative oxygen-independent coproporphyrinogen oxidase [Bacteroidetes bacterium]|nr:putative oxygen-independent coproporphyrinogen oxidase [Bacteroidota bacterium]